MSSAHRAPASWPARWLVSRVPPPHCVFVVSFRLRRVSVRQRPGTISLARRFSQEARRPQPQAIISFLCVGFGRDALAGQTGCTVCLFSLSTVCPPPRRSHLRVCVRRSLRRRPTRPTEMLPLCPTVR